MESTADTGRKPSILSDTELLHRIGYDLRSVYAEIIKQPLPPKIKATLARIEREQGRAGYQSQSGGI